MRCGPRCTRRDPLPAWRRRDMRAPPRQSPKPYRSVPCSGCGSGLSAGAAQLVKVDKNPSIRATRPSACVASPAVKIAIGGERPYAFVGHVDDVLLRNTVTRRSRVSGACSASHSISAPNPTPSVSMPSLSLLVRVCGLPPHCPSCLRHLLACRAQRPLSLRAVACRRGAQARPSQTADMRVS